LRAISKTCCPTRKPSAMPLAMDLDIPSDRPADMPSASPGAERWVTLRELAELRGISQHSAARLVRRHRWRRQADNQGRVRALVPAEALDRPTDKPGAMPANTPRAGLGLFGELVAALEPVTALLREQIEQANRRADMAEGRAERAEDQATKLRERLDAAEAQARNAEKAADQARQHVREAEDAIAELRQADEAWKAKGRWQRIRMAWQGER
jgi:hypothetical protein